MHLNYKEKSLENLEIVLPASKSISNRVLIIQALSEGSIEFNNLSDAKDTQVLLEALTTSNTKKDIGIAGTAARFLASFLCLQEGSFELTGNERIQKRPMKELLDALKYLGASIICLGEKNHLPIQIKGSEIQGGKLEINASISSQFISSLLLIAPKLKNGLELNLIGEINSRPYIEMTLELLRYFGVESIFSERSITIREQDFLSKTYTIEADWSSASYFYSCLALLDEGSLLLKNLNFDSIQGDSILGDIFYRLGVKTSRNGEAILLEKSNHVIDYLEYDFKDCPDLAQTVICTCIGLGIEGRFSGLSTLKHKETDRVKAIQEEIKKFNWLLLEEGTSYALKRNNELKNHVLQIKTYDDHRMAMAFAPLAIIYDDIEIVEENVVVKSFPNFWKELNKIGIY